jgi:eukaryotic-like serine/threonine-protein kinase
MPEPDDGPSDERIEDDDPIRGDDRIRDLEQQVDRLLSDRTTLRVDLQGRERELARVRQLNEELLSARAELEERLEQLSSERTQLPVSAVGDQLRAALVELGRAPAPEDARLDYQARSARFELKANLGFDEQGTAVLRFPAIGEQVHAHELASIQLEFDASPRPDVDLSALVPVPQLVGAPEELARARLESAGLVVGRRSERETLATAGTVVEQDPPRGAYADLETPVDLVVAVPRRVAVPDVVGRPLGEATAILRAAGFEVPEAATAAHEDRPEGEVLEQEPTAGERSDHGSEVRLTVAVAPERVNVPNVRGSALDVATAALEKAGLARGRVSRLRSDEEAGIVLWQDPAAGTAVAPGTGVDLVVAEQVVDRSVETPEVVGRRRDRAVETLHADGWTVGLKRAEEPDAKTAREDGRYGTVVDQDPRPGQPVLVSEKRVTLHVVVSPEPIEELEGLDRELRRRLVEHGIRTVGDLVCLPLDDLAELLGGEPKRAGELHHLARRRDDAFGLRGVEGVDRDLADLLVHAGVRHVRELAEAEPAELSRRLRATAQEHPTARTAPWTPAALRAVIGAASRRRGPG